MTRPSQIYISFTREQILTQVREWGYRIVAFRAPVRGENFIPAGGGLRIGSYNSYYPKGNMVERLILEEVV